MRRVTPLHPVLAACGLLLGGSLPPLHEAFRLEVAGEYEAAAARYTVAIDDAPGSEVQAALGLGRCLERLERREQAASAFGWALSRPGTSARETASALAGVGRDAPAWIASREASPGVWILSRAEALDAVAGSFQILSQLKVEPYLERDGRVGGLMLRSVAPDCLVARRGFQAYDIVRRVNRRPLTSSGADEILALLGALKDEPWVEVEIERLGEARTLRFEILDDRGLALRRGPFPRPALPPKETTP